MPLDDAPDEYRYMYRPEEVVLRPNVYVNGELPVDEHWFKIYMWDFMYYQEHAPYTEQLPQGFDLRHLTARYYGMTTWVDDMVGKLMQGLRANGLADDTVVLFMSDHGDNLGSHHLFNKNMLIEESIRIPMVWAGPGVVPGVNVEQVAQTIDVMPTVVDLCGGHVPDSVQGRSLSPILGGARASLEETGAYIETDKGEIGLRTPTHLYGMQLDDGNETAGNDSFFDLTVDPFEQNNQAGTDQQQGRGRDLRRQLCVWNDTTPRL
jgi:arylsulfatase A-like enzyme